MARSARPTVIEYVSQREAARLVGRMNRAKSELRDLVKKWRRRERVYADLPEAVIYMICADDLERWLDGKD